MASEIQNLLVVELNLTAAYMGLAKNWLTEVIELSFCYSASVPADGT